MRRSILAGLTIFGAWSSIDALAHRWVLEPMYSSSASLWRPLPEMNTSLILAATLILVVVFVVGYRALVRPKSLATAVCFGGLLGVALGTASGLGTYIHSPIPVALAWGWFILGTAKGVAAGLLLAAIVPEERNA